MPDAADEALVSALTRTLFAADHIDTAVGPVDITGVQAAVEGRYVTLRGAVPSTAQRDALVRYVSAQPHVLGVVDKLDVAPRAPSIDEELRERLRAALAGDARLAGADVSIDVKDGAVTLAGRIPSEPAHRAAVAAVKATRGVKVFHDELRTP